MEVLEESSLTISYTQDPPYPFLGQF